MFLFMIPMPFLSHLCPSWVNLPLVPENLAYPSIGTFSRTFSRTIMVFNDITATEQHGSRETAGFVRTNTLAQWTESDEITNSGPQRLLVVVRKTLQLHTTRSLFRCWHPWGFLVGGPSRKALGSALWSAATVAILLFKCARDLRVKKHYRLTANK